MDNKAKFQFLVTKKKGGVTMGKSVIIPIQYIHVFAQQYDKHVLPAFISLFWGEKESPLLLNPAMEGWHLGWHGHHSPIILSVPLAGGVQEEVL